MKIGIIGNGRMGSALAKGWASAGHEVQTANRSTVPTVKEVADWANIIVLAVPYKALSGIAQEIGPSTNKVVIDCTNPLTLETGVPSLTVGHNTSGAEELQTRLPETRVVKTLNQVGVEVLADTRGFAHPPVQLMAGDNNQSKDIVAGLLKDLGFEPMDSGDLSTARLIEPFALIWINQSIVQGKGRNWAFGAMPKEV